MTSLRSFYTNEPAHGAYSLSIDTGFTIPNIGEADTQRFDNVTWVSVGQSVFLGDNTNHGYFDCLRGF